MNHIRTKLFPYKYRVDIRFTITIHPQHPNTRPCMYIYQSRFPVVNPP